MRIVRTLSLLSGLLLTLTLATPATAAPLAENYVALGDSYASGTGAGSYGTSGSCYRSANAYGPLWATAHGATFTFAACSGAETADVLNSQVAALSAATTLVTIAIGGNDAGFADIVTTCTFDSQSACLAKINEARAFVESTLPGRLDAVYGAIRARAPSARVIVLGYPRLFTSSSCWWFSATRRNALNSAADLLSNVIAGRAAAAGFTYEDTRGQLRRPRGLHVLAVDQRGQPQPDRRVVPPERGRPRPGLPARAHRDNRLSIRPIHS